MGIQIYSPFHALDPLTCSSAAPPPTSQARAHRRQAPLLHARASPPDDGHNVVASRPQIEPLAAEISGVEPNVRACPSVPFADLDCCASRSRARDGGLGACRVRHHGARDQIPQMARLLVERRSQFAIIGACASRRDVDRRGRLRDGFDHIALASGRKAHRRECRMDFARACARRRTSSLPCAPGRRARIVATPCALPIVVWYADSPPRHRDRVARLLPLSSRKSRARRDALPSASRAPCEMNGRRGDRCRGGYSPALLFAGRAQAKRRAASRAPRAASSWALDQRLSQRLSTPSYPDHEESRRPRGWSARENSTPMRVAVDDAGRASGLTVKTRAQRPAPRTILSGPDAPNRARTRGSGHFVRAAVFPSPGRERRAGEARAFRQPARCSCSCRSTQGVSSASSALAPVLLRNW